MITPPKSMRLFVGLPLSPSAQRSLLELCRRLRALVPEARWVSEDLMHITLFFLGDTPPERLPEVLASLEQIQSPPVDLTLDGVGAFERAGILFAAVEPTPRLLHLAEEVKHRMIRCGFSSKEAEYKPHITLARTRHGLKKLLAASRKDHPLQTRFSSNRFLLYRSHLSKEGSHYEVVREFPLSGAVHTT